jgi:FkbM family methyltransferase
MDTRKPEPMTCTRCHEVKACTKCSFDLETVDFKSRTGICKICALKFNNAKEVFTRNQSDTDVVNEVINGDCYLLNAMKQRGFQPRVIVDVGAHIGTFSVLAHSLWPEARIISIEPNAESFEVLKQNAPFATLFNLAIGDPGEANLVAAEGQPGSSFVADVDWQDTANWKSQADHRKFELSVTVKCEIFENILTQAGIDRDIDLLKLDCEGGEFHLLRLLPQALASRIKNIVGEYHHPGGFDTFRNIAQNALPHLNIVGKNKGSIGPFWGFGDEFGIESEDVISELCRNYGLPKVKQLISVSDWLDVQPGKFIAFDDYRSVKHSMLRFSDSNNIAIQMLPNNKAMLQKPLHPAKYGQVTVQSTCEGIGDMICALYACCGIADAGFEVFFYAKHTSWLKRASYPNVHILDAEVLSIPDNAIDLGMRYGQQTRNATCRKQWYCENFRLAKGIFEFGINPAIPEVDFTRKDGSRHELGEYVVISPFSHDTGRNWENVKWIDLVSQLTELGIHCAVIDAPDQQSRVADVFGGLQNVTFHIGQSANDVSDLMLQSKGFIGIDSGMTHFAGLLRVPSVAVTTQFPSSLLWGLTGIKGFDADVSASTLIQTISHSVDEAVSSTEIESAF